MTNDIRALAQQIFMAGVAAADPYAGVLRGIDGFDPALILSVGKAARRMAEAALGVTPSADCIVVTNYENAAPLQGAKVMSAGHPVPDDNGAAGAAAFMDAIKSTDGPVLVLVSGGGSALLPAPVEGVSLQDKAEVSRLLLGSGADIHAMNLVRQQLSQLKGGGLARLCAGRPLRALILSDVVGDDLSTIASGPTVAALGTRAEAQETLERYGLWDKVADSVRAHLSNSEQKVGTVSADNILIGSNAQSVAALKDAAGPDCYVIDDPIEGDVADAARQICDAAGPGITVWGGETTVTLKGTGKGGRNQELSLLIAQEAARRGWTDWCCLQGGSDGRDGPTDAAGGIVDQDTLSRIAAARGDIDALLANNDSYEALKLAADLLITGGTGTNVADLGVMIRR
ncbi:glycerate kinase [Marivivens niveibacter]|uniref:Glycerate kinase n=1 Tax=Marivivens niveibacter TaxID=1930667 RepID=A0A251X1Y2_9RHOB|nr:DUF4147 domain-containing protein [Marivivens niveibacter]OUD10622.1 glycerate kinase [Marivivens niveibacter]